MFSLEMSSNYGFELRGHGGTNDKNPCSSRAVPGVEEKVSSEQLEQDACQAPHVRARVVPDASDHLHNAAAGPLGSRLRSARRQHLNVSTTRQGMPRLIGPLPLPLTTNGLGY